MGFYFEIKANGVGGVLLGTVEIKKNLKNVIVKPEGIRQLGEI